MEENLRTINQFISTDHWLDLFIPDTEFRELSGLVDDEADEFGDVKEQPRDIDLLFRNKLHRVFNNGTFNDGGRFYGGWWQGVPRRYRRYLTINGFPTAELDYSNMQIAMLYADQGLQLEGDAYEIEGIPPTHRKLIKRTLFKIINAEGRIRAPRVAERPDGWTWRQILDAVRAKHAPIAEHFQTGVGVQLQRRDADIAETVMLTMMAEGRLALPIHDSFVVIDGDQLRLREIMRTAYREHLNHEIDIDADATLFDAILDTLPHDMEFVRRMGFTTLDEYVRARDAEGIEDMQDHMGRIEERPEYAFYRERKADFLREKGERWIHEHPFVR